MVEINNINDLQKQKTKISDKLFIHLQRILNNFNGLFSKNILILIDINISEYLKNKQKAQCIDCKKIMNNEYIQFIYVYNDISIYFINKNIDNNMNDLVMKKFYKIDEMKLF